MHVDRMNRTLDTHPNQGISRRRFLQGALAFLASTPTVARAQSMHVPLADVHSHYGMITRTLADSGFADDMRRQRVALVAWKLVADARWIRRTTAGIAQVSDPAPGELAKHFNGYLERMRAYIAEHGLKTVLTPADVDACIAGEAGIVLASEGADFLEGRVDALEAAFDKGLRHLQFVHYIRTPVGDFQTVAPTHQGLSDMGKQLVAACNAKGVLIDLAHSTAQAVEQALQLSTQPMIWSHGWVDGDSGHWQDQYGYMKRRLSLAQAKHIAARGGVVGLWALGLTRPGFGWSVGRADAKGYAQEIANLVNKIGAEHVAFGTDIEGVGPTWALNHYGHLRRVVEYLDEMKLGTATIARVAYGNYARVLKAVLKR